ncbi:MAG: hypothetical protein AB9882_04540 [Ignavibacteriaceae bacterium]
MQKFLLFLLFGLVIMNCSSTQYVFEKMDSPLIMKINELEKINSNVVISFLGKTNMNIDDGMKLELENTGIVIETVVGDIFTAKGDRLQIAELSRKDCIEKLELSVYRPLFKN